MDVLPRNSTGLYDLRKELVPIRAAQMSAAKAHTTKIAECWVKMGRESFPWVHWVVVHSAALVKRYGTLSVFSSILFEHCHTPFQKAARDNFWCWCLQRQVCRTIGWDIVMGMKALNIGLRRQTARNNLKRLEAIRDKRRRHCRFV